MRLEGRLIVLEPLRAEHEEALRTAAADPVVWRWMQVDASTPEGFDLWFGHALREAAAEREVPFVTVERDTGRVLGSTRYLSLRPEHRGVEIGIGAKATGMNAVDGAEVIDLVDVAGDAERTHDFARRVADELTAAFEEQRPIRKLGKRLHEGRLLFCLLQHKCIRSVIIILYFTIQHGVFDGVFARFDRFLDQIVHQ